MKKFVNHESETITSDESDKHNLLLGETEKEDQDVTRRPGLLARTGSSRDHFHLPDHALDIHARYFETRIRYTGKYFSPHYISFNVRMNLRSFTALDVISFAVFSAKQDTPLG